MQTKTKRQLESEVEHELDEFCEIMRLLLAPEDPELIEAALALDEKMRFGRRVH